MPVNARQYREELYRMRAHPDAEPTIHSLERKDATTAIYFSLLPFLAAEYFVERTFDGVPSGLLFPSGYLLFWAFYFTFNRPNYLENHLGSKEHWNFAQIPGLLMSVAIWFVKVTIVEVGKLFLFTRAPKPQARPKARPRPVYSRPLHQQTKYAEGSWSRPSKPVGPPPLPTEVQRSLLILGLENCRDWEEIHRRYRELAKRFHPDLNQDITNVGNRFMVVDGAYRRLCAVKSQYFTARR